MVDAKKVLFWERQVTYGRNQGLKAAGLAFLVMGVVLAGGFLLDPLNFYQEKTITGHECRLNPFSWSVPHGWTAVDDGSKVICKTISFTQVYLNWFAFAMYIHAAFSAFVVTLLVLGLGCYPKKAREDFARNLIIYGEEQVFSYDPYGYGQTECKKEEE